MAKKILLSLLTIVFFALVFYALIVLPRQKSVGLNLSYDQGIFSTLHYEVPGEKIGEYKTFASEQEFHSYIEDMPQGGFLGAVPEVMMADSMQTRESAFGDGAVANKGVSAGSGEPRYSETNVQVKGVDEPDMVKTDGKNIFVSSMRSFYNNRISIDFDEGVTTRRMDEDFVDRIAPQYENTISAIAAFPPADMSVLSEVDMDGELLLFDNILVALGQEKMIGYDISDPRNTREVWSIKVNENSRIKTARLMGDELYVINETYIDHAMPCPLRPMTAMEDIVIPCHTIYHPIEPSQVDVTYTILKIDVNDGDVDDQTSFVGSTFQSAVYMSEQALYVSHQHQLKELEMMFEFLLENHETFPDHVIERIKKLEKYDISDSSKMSELVMILDRYEQSLDKDERLRIENDMENAMTTYMERRKRDMEQTGIAKIDLDAMKVTQTGYVPGRLLNQFSLDEHDGFLRVATTIGGSWSRFGGQQESVNDVYVLNDTMSIVGSVEDMGKDERIYAVRFLGDKGYIVTFKQIDPFIILDLKDPYKPKKRGELKIPGFSSYLHPLGKDRILGIGREANRVKISLFDVSDDDNPLEIAKFSLDEYWSEISQTHHAFLADEKHKVFFIPGSKGGYVFSYANDGIELKKAISENGVKRALYIGDYLYIIANDKIIVLSESDWERVQELDLTEEQE